MRKVVELKSNDLGRSAVEGESPVGAGKAMGELS